LENNIYEYRVVAFLDILGFSKLTKDSEHNQQMFDIIFDAITSVRLMAHELRQGGLNRPEIALFSDNIAISYKADGGCSEFNLLADAILIQTYLLYKGVLVRGGITKGLLYQSSNLIFGPALVKAYEIESRYAVYPRIVVDESIKGEGTIFSIDFDGLCFLDFLNNPDVWGYFMEKFLNTNVNQVFYQVKRVVEEKYKNSDSNIGVKAKLHWLMNYCQETFELDGGDLRLLRKSPSTFHRVLK